MKFLLGRWPCGQRKRLLRNRQAADKGTSEVPGTTHGRHGLGTTAGYYLILLTAPYVIVFPRTCWAYQQKSDDAIEHLRRLATEPGSQGALNGVSPLNKPPDAGGKGARVDAGSRGDPEVRTKGAAGRIALAVLPFADLDHPTNPSHWRYTLPLLLKMQLAQIQQIRILPDDSIEFGPDQSVQFAYREAGDMRESPQKAYRELGLVLDADWIAGGTYQKQGGSWKLKGWAENIHTGQYRMVTSGSWPELFPALCHTRRQLLKALGIALSGQQETRLDCPPTGSVTALNLMGGALANAYGEGSLADTEQKLRKALAIDPSFAVARAMLSRTLEAEGDLPGATEQAKRVVRENPDLASAHYILGTAYLGLAGQARDNNGEDPESERLAQVEFEKARQLAPDEPVVLVGLAQLARLKGENQEAMLLLRRANATMFYAPQIHEQMALIYITAGNRDEALRELETAERFDSGKEYQSTASLAQITDALNLTLRAVHYYDQLITATKRIGVDDLDLAGLKEHLEELKARLKPHFATVSPPRSFTPDALRTAVRQTLGKAGGPLPRIPFDQNPEMAAWAHRIVGTNSDELTKAKLLFEAMTRRIEGNHWGRQRTAEQAFKAWTIPQAKFSCEDYTFLYVCLARDVGLKAFYVQVTKDHSGDPVLHASPGVFIGKKAVLVDPAYDWFGVPHQEYAFEDDLEATALFWSQSADLKLNTYAAKLAPESPLVHFIFAWSLAGVGQTNRAMEELRACIAKSKHLWLGAVASGCIELYEGHAENAVDQLRKCLGLYPNYSALHFFLAEAYEATGDLDGARREYSTFMQQEDDPSLVNDARQKIKSIDGKLDRLDRPVAEPAARHPKAPAPDAGRDSQRAEPSS